MCRRQRGFTLIELLVVVAIITVLVSILLPSLKKAKEIAKMAVCLSNQHQCGLSAQLYASDYALVMAVGGRKPKTWGPGLPWMNFLGGTSYSSVEYMARKSEAQRCPKNGTKGTGAWWGPADGTGSYAFIQPTSYLVSDPAKVSAPWDPSGADSWAQGAFVGVRVSLIEQPADYVLLADSAVKDGAWGALKYPDPPGVYSLSTWLSSSPTGGGQSAAVWLTHPTDRGNMLFADGHGETCAEEQILGTSNYNPEGPWSGGDRRGISQWWWGDGSIYH
jgi:prepilin-type N-terminal cleavage/methylation domain-containing protein/prepilin-type processing-associated H-X9-DG protein